MAIRFPAAPEIDLGVQPITIYDQSGRGTTRRMQHLAIAVNPHGLPEIITELRILHYGSAEPENPTAFQHHAFLSACMAALSNAIWQL